MAGKTLRGQFESISDFHNITNRISIENVMSLHAQIIGGLTVATRSAHDGEVAQLIKVANEVRPSTIVDKAIYGSAQDNKAFGDFLDVLQHQTKLGK